ncbi:MAG: LytTR family DNA-binding domain-containing protein [Fulvivirga sp.]
MKCIAVDDDALFLTILSGFINKTESLELLESFESAVDAYNFLQKNSVDLIFLDVEMPQMSGIELIESLENQPQIIMVSSEQKYVIDAFNLNVAAYLLKPLDNYSKFLSAVKKAEETMHSRKRSMFVKEEHKLVRIHLEDIKFIEAFGDYVKLHTAERFHITYTSMKELLNKLPSGEFVQVHRSYIVALDHVAEVDGNMLKVGDKSIPMSRGKRDIVLQKLQS